ncbi:hypothetical protein [Breoghania sp.]|uniref:hypothetical protein n=1 Tax=Breoghania sp. TaxID=2065378 RepID=UPI002AA6C8D9|nr:hypothetical protein [Breoghania sp.]
MPLTGKSTEEIEALEAELMAGVPAEGNSIGNKRLRDEILQWETSLYLAVRKRLIDDGKLITGRGKGGSIRRAPTEEEPGPAQDVEGAPEAELPQRALFPEEKDLYDPMLAVIKDRWVLDQPFDQVLVEKTDRGGRRPDGIWTRPDITVAAMTSYTFVPGRHFDIVTFEIKHYSGLNVTAVYEALAHRRAATRSYVLVYVPDDQLEKFETPTLAEVVEEASRHGIGLIVAGDPTDFDTWDIREDAERLQPDPARLNIFIRNQLSEGTKDQIVRWFR